MKKKQLAWRVGLYLFGINCAAFGLRLCTIADMGVATITSIPYSLSRAFNLNFPTTMFLVNMVFFLMQMVIKGRIGLWKKWDWFQIPCVFMVTSLLEVYERILDFQVESLWSRILVVIVGIIFMGICGSLTVNMQFAPVPSDGIVYAISLVTHQSLGNTKNIVDAFCILLACGVDLLGNGKISSIGLATVLCMIFMGRVIAVFEYFCKAKYMELAGLTDVVAEKKTPKAAHS